MSRRRRVDAALETLAQAEWGMAAVAVGETVIVLHPPLPFAGVSIGIKRGCHQNNSLADGYLQRARVDHAEISEEAKRLILRGNAERLLGR